MSDEVHGECPDQGTLDQLREEWEEVFSDAPLHISTRDSSYEIFVEGWNRAKAYYATKVS